MSGVSHLRPRRVGPKLGVFGAVLLLALVPSAQQIPVGPAPAAADDGTQAAPAPWYLQRGTQPRAPGPLEDLPGPAQALADLLRDQRVPGFYDGQFASTAADVPGLVRIIRDPSLHHVLRMMASMALQEAADGELVASVLDPLILDPNLEFAIEQAEWEDFGRSTEEDFVREILRADLSRHARFALAKDGQPARVLEKIEVMERRVWKRRYLVLDPSIRSEQDPDVAWLRQVWFDVGYHFQQFDDFANATRWFSMLAENLSHEDSRWAHYNLACMAALTGQPEDAMVQLEAAVEDGFLDVEWMQEDGDLTSLRGRADFEALVERLGGSPRDPALLADRAPPESDADPSSQPKDP